MNTFFKRTMLAATLAIGITGTSLAAGFGNEGPGVNYQGYDWLVTTYNAAYAVIPADVKSTVDTTNIATTYTTTVKEVLNPWTIQNTLIPTLQKNGTDTLAYKNYGYTMANYIIRVNYAYKDIAEAKPSLKTYYVAKESEQDYDANGMAIGEMRKFPKDLVQVQPGSDEYQIAYELEKGYYNDQVISNVPVDKNLKHQDAKTKK